MQRVCLDRQRRNPLIDRKIRGSILLMGKLNAYQKRQILISFSIQTLSHTFIYKLFLESKMDKVSGKTEKICTVVNFFFKELDYFIYLNLAKDVNFQDSLRKFQNLSCTKVMGLQS
jgi:hypothetical protein